MKVELSSWLGGKPYLGLALTLALLCSSALMYLSALSRGESVSTQRSRRLDRDFEAVIPPFANEFSSSPLDDVHKFIELLSVELAPIQGFVSSRRLQTRQHWFGDSVRFYNRIGTFLGSETLFDSKSGAFDSDLEINVDGEVAFATVKPSRDKLPKKGGIICLYGFSLYRFTRVLAYGNVSSDIKLGGDSACTGFGIDELVTDSTSDTPGRGESYQRTGSGLAPENFRWIVAPTTIGRVNNGQTFPRCTTECTIEGRYLIHKKGFLGRCHEKCNRDFFVKIRTPFFQMGMRRLWQLIISNRGNVEVIS